MMTQQQYSGPCAVLVKEGKTYAWCACGRSANQPFCDGSHSQSGMEPRTFTAERDEWVWLCGCKRTGHPPYCDGSHKRTGQD